LFLRPDHSSEGTPLKTLTDGSIVTVVGEDFSAPNRVWKHVRDAEGAEGWAAADFLQAVP
jgi:SH3-like domain-containing protein